MGTRLVSLFDVCGRLNTSAVYQFQLFDGKLVGTQDTSLPHV